MKKLGFTIKPAPMKEIKIRQNFLIVKASTPIINPITITNMGFKFKIIAMTERGRFLKP